MIHHSDAGSQYTSLRFTTHLVDAGLDAFTGSVGDALDNALMESAIGRYKTELINSRGPWRNLAARGHIAWASSANAVDTRAAAGRQRRVRSHRDSGRAETLQPAQPGRTPFSAVQRDPLLSICGRHRRGHREPCADEPPLTD